MPHSDDGTPDCEAPGLSLRDGPPKNPPCSSAHSSSLPFCLCCTISRYEKINFSLFFPAQLFNCMFLGLFLPRFSTLLFHFMAFQSLFSRKCGARNFWLNNLWNNYLRQNKRFVARVVFCARSGGRREAKRAQNAPPGSTAEKPLRFPNISKTKLVIWNQYLI